MSSLVQYHTGDDELLILLMDAPTRWLVRNGIKTISTSTLRHALRAAYDFSSRGKFTGSISKQPNDEMMIDACQVHRLWEYLGLTSFAEVINPKILGLAAFPAA